MKNKNVLWVLSLLVIINYCTSQTHYITLPPFPEEPKDNGIYPKIYSSPEVYSSQKYKEIDYWFSHHLKDIEIQIRDQEKIIPEFFPYDKSSPLFWDWDVSQNSSQEIKMKQAVKVLFPHIKNWNCFDGYTFTTSINSNPKLTRTTHIIHGGLSDRIYDAPAAYEYHCLASYISKKIDVFYTYILGGYSSYTVYIEKFIDKKPFNFYSFKQDYQKLWDSGFLNQFHTLFDFALEEFFDITKGKGVVHYQEPLNYWELLSEGLKKLPKDFIVKDPLGEYSEVISEMCKIISPEDKHNPYWEYNYFNHNTTIRNPNRPCLEDPTKDYYKSIYPHFEFTIAASRSCYSYLLEPSLSDIYFYSLGNSNAIEYVQYQNLYKHIEWITIYEDVTKGIEHPIAAGDMEPGWGVEE